MFEIGLRRRTSMDLRVVVDIGQILALLGGEFRLVRQLTRWYRHNGNLEGIVAEAIEDTHADYRKLPEEYGPDRPFHGCVEVLPEFLCITTVAGKICN